jgi:hypothetical protein
MTTLEQAEQLRKQAIKLLLVERNLIDEKLASLGHDGITNRETSRGARKSCGKCGESGHNSRKCPKTESTPPLI